jgi:hypothetical protein
VHTGRLSFRHRAVEYLLVCATPFACLPMRSQASHLDSTGTLFLLGPLAELFHLSVP